MLQNVELPLLDDRTVIARPISPLERAQALQDVTTADSIVGMVQERLGPEQAALLVDGPKTYRAIKDTLKDRLVEFRSEEQIMKMIQMMQQQQAPNEPQTGQG